MTTTLGLTGSIGMGKSTTAQIFKERGCAVWDADAAVHRLYAKDGAAVRPIGKLYPKAIIDGAVSREILKNWIHSDPDALGSIENIVHPLVKLDRDSFRSGTEADVAVFDIPLLFEQNAETEFDATACVFVDKEIQKARVLERPGMTEEHFNMILSKQLPAEKKLERATYQILTKTLETARTAVDFILDDLSVRFKDA